MIFKSITLENFRPYYGEKIIKFCNGEKNITLIKAENGSGKTTLLEAIRWCLYGNNLKLNSGSHQKNGAVSFVNKKYLSENSKTEVFASVKVELIGKSMNSKVDKFKEDNYTIIRKISFKDDRLKEVKLDLEINGEKFDEKLILSKQEIIENILPKEINFFVDGERLQNIAPELDKKKNNNNLVTIQESIYRVLGIKSLENAIIDLENLRKKLEKNYLEGKEVETELKELYFLEEEKRGNLKKKREVRNNLSEELGVILEQKINLEKKLEEIPKTISQEKQYEKDLALLEIEINNIEIKKQKLEEKYQEILSVKGVEFISNKIINNAYKILASKKENKGIPSRYEKEFLQELLKQKECICGQKLIEGTDNFDIINKKIKIAEERKDSVEILNESYYILGAFKNDNYNILKEIKELKIEILEIERSIEKKKNEQNLLKNKITDMDFLKQYEKLTNNKDELEKSEKNLLIEIELISRDIEMLSSEYQETLKKRVEKEKKEKKHNSEINKKDFCERMLYCLIKLKVFKEIQGREELKEKIEEVYSKINKKDYKVELSEKFEYKVYDQVDKKEIGASGGESKNKALSFIGGLIYYAKELNKNKGMDVLTNGGIYPLVLDAPYGDLDNEYRLDFTKMLPNLSEQVIVMVSS
ncbi:MAG: AAA family ATPase, partial [Cetobacterium sp.]